MLDTCDCASLIDRRDRALVLLGLVAARAARNWPLTVADLDFVDEGMSSLSCAASPTRRQPARS